MISKKNNAALSSTPLSKFSMLNSSRFWFCLSVVYTAIWIFLAINGVQISHEHGPMENAQAWCLSLGFLLFGTLAVQMKTRDYKILFATLALFYLSFVLREVEVEDLNIPQVLILLGSGSGKKYLLVTCWLIAIGFFLTHRKATWLAFKRWFGTLAGRTIAIGGIFYLLGMPFDKKAFSIDYDLNVLSEEILETVATLWMLASAFASTLYFRGSGAIRPPE